MGFDYGKKQKVSRKLVHLTGFSKITFVKSGQQLMNMIKLIKQTNPRS